jgi:hypothetical protein
MTMLKFNMLDLDQAESFVKNTPNVWWENYDIIIWQSTNSGWSKTNGKFHNNQWGTAKRVVVNNNGLWKVPTSVRTSR